MPVYAYTLDVFYEDTDTGGVVYYANYLKFMERARTQWLRSLGIVQSDWFAQDVAFVVRRITVDYHFPAKLDDVLHVTVDDVSIKHASMRLTQHILHAQHQTTLVTAQVSIACVSMKTKKPQALPREMKGVLSHAL